MDPGRPQGGENSVRPLYTQKGWMLQCEQLSGFLCDFLYAFPAYYINKHTVLILM